jgi:hypothetical protein
LQLPRQRIEYKAHAGGGEIAGVSDQPNLEAELKVG